MMRIVDVLYSQPSIIFVIVLVTTLGGLIKHAHFMEQSATLGGVVRIALLFVALGAISWLSMARIVRGQALPCGPGNLWKPVAPWAGARDGFSPATLFQIRLAL